MIKVDIQKGRRDEVLHTKSTDYVDQKEWVEDAESCDDNYVGDGKSDCTVGIGELTPRTRANVTGIARLLLKQSPCSIPRRWEDPAANKGSIMGKGITTNDLKYTESLYHQMVEKNKISDKDSLEILHEINPAAFINKHLDNIEVLTRGISVNDNNDDAVSSGDARERSDFKDRKMMTGTQRKNIRKNALRSGRSQSGKNSASTVKVLKEIAVCSWILSYSNKYFFLPQIYLHAVFLSLQLFFSPPAHMRLQVTNST